MLIQNFKPLPKLPMKARFDVVIPQYKNFTIYGLTWFSKNDKEWITFPSYKVENEDTFRYLQHCRFPERSDHDAMTKYLLPMLKELDKEYQAQPKPEQNQFSEEELPF